MNKPIPMRIPCPECNKLHIDEGVFATKPHHTHACQFCGAVWRPAVVDTVGVKFLPGFKNDEQDIENDCTCNDANYEDYCPVHDSDLEYEDDPIENPSPQELAAIASRSKAKKKYKGPIYDEDNAVKIKGETSSIKDLGKRLQKANKVIVVTKDEKLNKKMYMNIIKRNGFTYVKEDAEVFESLGAAQYGVNTAQHKHKKFPRNYTFENIQEK